MPLEAPHPQTITKPCNILTTTKSPLLSANTTLYTISLTHFPPIYSLYSIFLTRFYKKNKKNKKNPNKDLLKIKNKKYRGQAYGFEICYGWGVGVQIIHFQSLTTTTKIFFHFFHQIFSLPQNCTTFASPNGQSADDGRPCDTVLICLTHKNF